MELQIKERLVGAGVLVVLGVLLIPEFLSGPADQNEDTGSTIALPAAEDQETRSHTIRLDQKDAREKPPVAQPVTEVDDVHPEPAPQSAEKAAPEAKVNAPPPVKKQADKQPEAVIAEASDEKPPPKPGGWAVQIGSFSSADNATRLASTIESMGYKSFVTQIVVNGKTHNRVRVGPMATREDAEATAAELQEQGQQASVVTQP